MSGSSTSKTKNFGQAHQAMLNQLLPGAKPVNAVPAVWKQWALWLAVTLAWISFVLWKLEVQDNLGQVLSASLRPLAFLLTAFLGSVLAAWKAVASSVPGRQTGTAYNFLSTIIIAVLFLIPFFFFTPSPEGLSWISFRDGFGCFQTASLTGVLPWLLLGWLISKNAAFHPSWAGAWSGVSAFLMGTVTVQIHCPSWQTDHMILSHLLPVALFFLLTAWVGTFWFSRWRK